VFQTHALFPHKTVSQNIAFGPRMKKVNKEIINDKVKEVAEMVKITHLLEKLPAQCSGGEAQRVAICRALINDPKILIADEPTANLDTKLSHEFMGLLDDLKKSGKTILITSHDPVVFDSPAVDRVVEMCDGLLLDNVGK